MNKVILLDIEPDDFILACRAVKWLIKQSPPIKDGILEFDGGQRFYVRHNKASITVRRMLGR